MNQVRNIIQLASFGVIALIAFTATIGGAGLFLSAVVGGPYALLRAIIGFPLYAVGMWLMFDVYKGRLKQITRITGGITLGTVACALVVMGLAVAAFPVNSVGAFAGTLAIFFGIVIGLSSACCFLSLS